MISQKLRLSESGEIVALDWDNHQWIQAAGDGKLFEIMLRGCPSGLSYRINNTDFEHCIRTESDNHFCLKFFGHPSGIEVEAAFQENGDEIHAAISYAKLRGDFYCDWISFPVLRLANHLKGRGGSARFFHPGCEGTEFDDLRFREKTDFCASELCYPLTGIGGYYPGPCPMQFMAYYDGDDKGLYLGIHDPTHSPKGLDVREESCGAVLTPFFQFFCGDSSPQSFSLPGKIVLKSFAGDWEDAALIYRRWMTAENKEALPVPLRQQTGLPGWFADSPVLAAYPVRGAGADSGRMDTNEFFPYDRALPGLRQLAKKWDSRVMALLMHYESLVHRIILSAKIPI